MQNRYELTYSNLNFLYSGIQCTLCTKYNKLKTKSTMMLAKIGQHIITESAVKVNMTSSMYNDAALKDKERKSHEYEKKIKGTLKITLIIQILNQVLEK